MEKVLATKALTQKAVNESALSKTVRMDNSFAVLTSLKTPTYDINYVKEFGDLIKFQVNTQLVNQLRGRKIKIQKIEDGQYDLNTDFYPVIISKLPIVHGVLTTPESLFSFIRLNINEFINKNYSEFHPLESIDEGLWSGSNPYGAVLFIDIAGPDNAAVVVSAYGNNKWVFTTVATENQKGKPGRHPVSGQREFGIVTHENTLIFYTKGADRTTDAVESVAGLMIPQSILGIRNLNPFYDADQLWISLQDGVTEFINKNGGSARINNRYSQRHKWFMVKQILKL